MFLLLEGPSSTLADDLPEFISSLQDAYVIGEVSARTLQGICASGLVRSSEPDNVKIMRNQNKAFCNAYIEGLVDAEKALGLKCSIPPDSADVRREIKKYASTPDTADAEIAMLIVERSLKCSR